MRALLCTLVVFVTSSVLVSAASMDTVYKWKYIDYVWDSEVSKQRAVSSGEYNYTQVVPMDVEKAPDGRVFVSLLGMKGVPAVLATLTDQMGRSGPLVKPYLNWSYFKAGGCDRIQNVYRIAIDECERLWVLDTGFVEEEEPKCDPQLLAFDLKSDRLIQKIKIPKNFARGPNDQSLLATPVVETYGSKCEDTTVYMADPFGHGLIVWNNGKLTRLQNPLFSPSVDAANITSGNYSVQWPAGLVTMAISPSLFPDESKYLYFHSLASFDLYFQTTGTLKSYTDGRGIKFFGTKNVLSSQAVGVAFSAEGTLFIGLTRESAVACWNKYNGLTSDNIKIVSQDCERLQYINGMKVIQRPFDEEELWILSNRLTTFEYDKYDFNEYNFFILKKSVEELIAGTVCEMPYKTHRALEEIYREYDDKLIFNR